MKLTSQLTDILNRIKVATIATTGLDGRPNLSHECSFRIFDDAHLIFEDSCSSIAIENLKSNPYSVIEIVDMVSLKGFRLGGKATVIPKDENALPYVSIYKNWCLEKVKSFALVKIETLEEVSPKQPESDTVTKTISYHNLWKF